MDWLSIATLVVVGLVGIGLFWGRRRVIHTFDEKLERLRADMRRDEAGLAALRSAVVGWVAPGQVALGQRRLQAADQLWTSVAFCKSGSALVRAVGRLNLAEVHKNRDDPATQQFVASVRQIGERPPRIRCAVET